MGSTPDTRGSESRLVAYVEALTRSLGHADRGAPFRSYCTGVLLPGARKSVEPMAARVEPGRVRAAHQSLHHFVAKADWSDEALLTAVRAHVLPIIEQRGPIRGQRIWAAHKLKPHRVRTFKRSRDPDFAAKLADIVGLYMDPPTQAVVRPDWPRLYRSARRMRSTLPSRETACSLRPVVLSA